LLQETALFEKLKLERLQQAEGEARPEGGDGNPLGEGTAPAGGAQPTQGAATGKTDRFQGGKATKKGGSTAEGTTTSANSSAKKEKQDPTKSKLGVAISGTGNSSNSSSPPAAPLGVDPHLIAFRRSLVDRLDLFSFDALLQIENGTSTLERWGPIIGSLAMLYGVPVVSLLSSDHLKLRSTHIKTSSAVAGGQPPEPQDPIPDELGATSHQLPFGRLMRIRRDGMKWTVDDLLAQLATLGNVRRRNTASDSSSHSSRDTPLPTLQLPRSPQARTLDPSSSGTGNTRGGTGSNMIISREDYCMLEAGGSPDFERWCKFLIGIHSISKDSPFLFIAGLSG
jgi:hypothetical protein